MKKTCEQEWIDLSEYNLSLPDGIHFVFGRQSRVQDNHIVAYKSLPMPQDGGDMTVRRWFELTPPTLPHKE